MFDMQQKAIRILANLLTKLPFNQWILIPCNDDTYEHSHSLSKVASDIPKDQLFALLLEGDFVARESNVLNNKICEYLKYLTL
jgi:hypothetical protein